MTNSVGAPDKTTPEIRELTSNEIAEVAGAGGNSFLAIEQEIICFIDHIIESFTHFKISDVAAKSNIELLGHLENGLGFYRFNYVGGTQTFVGVIAQEVEQLMPSAVVRGSDGLLRVCYEDLGVKFQTYDDWMKSGAAIPAGVPLN